MNIIRWFLIALNTAYGLIILAVLVKSMASISSAFANRFSEPEDFVLLSILILLLMFMIIASIYNAFLLLNGKNYRLAIILNLVISIVLLSISYLEWKYESPDFLIWIISTLPYIMTFIVLAIFRTYLSQVHDI